MSSILAEKKLLRPPTVIEPQTMSNYILIVDDDVFNLHVMETIIKKLGFDCIKSYSGKEALNIIEDLFQKDNIDFLKLILMDYLMPEMDGCECAKKIKEILISKEYPNEIPIIAVTANDDRAVYEKCLDSGMVELVAKPVSVEKMEKIFELWMN